MRYITLTLIFFFALISYGQTPTGAASNIVFTFTGCNEVSISWTNGNGADRVVFVREGAALSDVPVNNEYYTYNPIFGKGESIKGDNKHFCVYNGPGNTVTVKGLKKVMKYYVAVFDYNSASGGIYNYKTDTYPTKDITTKNIVANGYLYDPFDKRTKLGDGGQCLNGNNFQFRNKSTCDLTPLNYSWIFGDGNSSTLTEPNHAYNTIGIKNVTLFAMVPGCYDTIFFKDTVHPHPVAKFDFLSNDTIQCWYNNKFTFTNKTTLASIGVGPSSMRYEWYEVPNTTPFSVGYKADYSFKTAGKKTVKLLAVSNRGCRDSFYSTNKYTILPRAFDITKISISPTSLPLKNNSFTFTGPSTKKWQIRSRNNLSFKDSIVGSSVKYSFKTVGWFYISFDTTDAITGCYDKYYDSLEVKKDVGISPNKGLPNLAIYPNPTKTGIFVINNLPTDASLIVYSMLGKELLNFKVDETKTEIKLSGLGSGTYILSVLSEGRKFDYRLLVL